MYPYKHYLLRHAHRPPIPNESLGLSISITNTGRKKAQDLGVSFSNSCIEMIWTSPIKRCIQTAQELRKGLDKDIPIRYSKLLGNPGFMIEDPRIAKRAFLKYRNIELLHLLIKKIPIPGFYSVDIACKKMLEELTKNQTFSSISISHDFNICLLGCWIFQTENPQDLIPDFLEGLEFSLYSNEVCIDYKNLRVMIDKATLKIIEESHV